MDAEKLPEYLLLEFERRGTNQITLLKPRPDKDEDPPREVPKAWVGVATQPVLTKLARQLGAPESLGFRITRVYPGTLAAQSDLKIGDIIIAVNGERLTPRGMQDAGLFQRELRRLDIDSQATLSVLRRGEKLEVPVKLERTRITPQEARRDRNPDFEMTVRELTFFDRDENRWSDDIKGVLVESVESAGWADLGGIRSGDLIQRIGDDEITGLPAYRAAMEKVGKEQPERVVVVVLRGARTRFQYLEPDWRPVVAEKQAAAGQEQKQ
jgi:serine protease Do